MANRSDFVDQAYKLKSSKQFILWKLNLQYYFPILIHFSTKFFVYAYSDLKCY